MSVQVKRGINICYCAELIAEKLKCNAVLNNESPDTVAEEKLFIVK